MDKIYQFTITPITELFYNEDNLYGVYNFNTGEDIPHLSKTNFQKNIGTSVLVGKMQRLTIGVQYTCKATEYLNKKYNKWQYQVIDIKSEKPNTLEDVKLFLKCIITEKQAETLLTSYPNIINMVLNDEYVDLNILKGIGEKTFNIIKSKILDNYVLSDIISLLKPYGVTLNSIKKLMESETNVGLLKNKLKTNPYILTSVKGFGFKKIDSIAVALNHSLICSNYRLEAFIRYFLTDIGNKIGHSKIPLENLNKAIIDNVPECASLYNSVLESETINPKFIYIKDKCVGLYKYYKREKEIFDILSLLDKHNKYNISNINIYNAFEKFKNERGYDLVEEQKAIVHEMNNNNIVLLTGRAGAGKSSAMDVVVKAFVDKKIALTALSAKAVRRMVEATGRDDCKTIHRLLGFKGDSFEYNEDNKLDVELLIIDEASMINSSLFLSLLKAIPIGIKVLIVFDDGQLPPIGVGNVATDLLKNSFCQVSLNKVHRQAQNSGILSDANTIRDGINPIKTPQNMMVRGNLKDMYYIFKNDKQVIFDTTIDYFIKSLTNMSVNDISIVVPRKDNAINCTMTFNNKIQDILLANEVQSVKYGNKEFKLGSKVIQKVNDYDKNVVNGEIGFLIAIEEENVFKVKFEEKVVEYNIKDMDNLELAYALTTHSMQGSQNHTIIFVCDTSSYMLLSKELIYTSITRASKRCLVIAEPKAFNIGVKTNSSKRETWLNTIS